jgi:hypothetical protein
MRNSIAVAILVAGCTNAETTEAPAAALHHAKRIVVRTSEPPTVIAYRAEGSATWSIPTQKSPRHYEFAVTGPYRVAVICENADTGSVAIRQFARTPADDRSLDVTRCNTRAGAHRVTGTMVQPGLVWLGPLAAFGSSSNWAFDLAADRGKHAIIATTDTRIAVRRHVAVKHDTTLAPLDVDTEGHALQPVTFTASNLHGDETESTAVVWVEVDDTMPLVYNGDPAAAMVVPNAALRPRDEQLVTLAVHNPNVGRTITRRYRVGDPTTFPLPSGTLGPVTFDDFAATWTTLPTYEDLELSFYAFSFETFTDLEHRLDATRSWVDATGATGAALDVEDLPGMRPEWEIDPTLQYQRYIEASRTLANGDVVGSDISQTVNGF